MMAGLDIEDEIDARLNLILWLGFGCGLRPAGMLGLTFTDLNVGPEKWILNVIGNSDKLRTVLLESPVKTALLRYMSAIAILLEFAFRASSGLDAANAGQPLLCTQKGRRRRAVDGNKVWSTPILSRRLTGSSRPICRPNPAISKPPTRCQSTG